MYPYSTILYISAIVFFSSIFRICIYIYIYPYIVQLFLEIGLSEGEISAFFTGPAFLPWSAAHMLPSIIFTAYALFCPTPSNVFS